MAGSVFRMKCKSVGVWVTEVADKEAVHGHSYILGPVRPLGAVIDGLWHQRASGDSRDMGKQPVLQGFVVSPEDLCRASSHVGPFHQPLSPPRTPASSGAWQCFRRLPPRTISLKARGCQRAMIYHTSFMDTHTARAGQDSLCTHTMYTLTSPQHTF